MMKQTIKHKLLIQDFEVWVHLGCTVEEQKHTQPVHYNFEIDFENPVLGSQSDQLADTIDYVKITSILKMISTEKKFHLVEHLNQLAFDGIIEYLNSRNLKAAVKLSVKKIRVPVENLKNGVVFSCEAKL